LYGAIELSDLPNFKLKTWKRLGEGGDFEPNMTTSLITTVRSDQESSSSAELWEPINVLLWLYQDPQFDAASLRGRYITQQLYDHGPREPKAVFESLRGRYITQQLYDHGPREPKAVFEFINSHSMQQSALQEVLECDFAAATGQLAYATHCYRTAVETVEWCIRAMNKTQLTANHSVPVVPPQQQTLLVTGSQFSALHCGMAAATVLNYTSAETQLMMCHLEALQLRRARLLLLHAVDPQAALAALREPDEDNSVLIEVKTVFIAIADCLLGTCTAPSASVSAVCEDMLARLAVSKDFSLVHTLYAQVCAALQSAASRDVPGGAQRPVLQHNYGFDHTRSIVASLLSVGATHVAAVHVTRTMESHLGLSLSAPVSQRDFRDAYIALVMRQPSLALLFSHGDGDLNDLLQLNNVQAALTLRQALAATMRDDATVQTFVESGELMSLYLGAVLQATAPVTLSAAGTGAKWVHEAATLRYILVDVLQTLVRVCKRHSVQCELSDPVSNVGARGLFLLAYQGLGLLGESLLTLETSLLADDACAADDYSACTLQKEASALRWTLSDATVPQLYEELVRLTSPYTISPLIPPAITDRDGNEGVESNSDSSVAKELTRPNKIRVGFLSFFFRKHPVGRLLAPIITGLDSAQFDVHMITSAASTSAHSDNTIDEITDYLQTHIPADKWTSITHSTVEAVENVRLLALDVLVYGDIFMDSYVAHLAMHRLAPAQVG
jgi:hypothetical protein